MPILIQGQYLQHIIFSLQDWQAKMQQPYTIPAPGTLLRYADFDGSSDSLFLAQLAQQTKPVTIITANALDAQRLLEEIPYFAPELRTHLLPDWETLPYDTFSPDHDVIL